MQDGRELEAPTSGAIPDSEDKTSLSLVKLRFE